MTAFGVDFRVAEISRTGAPLFRFMEMEWPGCMSAFGGGNRLRPSPLPATPRKHPAVQDWLAKHPRFNMHFTPTSALWLNMVERFFRDITTERLRRGVFTSLPELIGAIDACIAHHNTKPKPFIWTKSARDILQKVIRANTRLSSKQNATLH
jgi:hypothetical protein